MLQRAAAVSDRSHDSDERRCQFMICPTPFYTAPYSRSKWEGLQLVSPLDLIPDCSVMTPRSAISMCYLKRNGFFLPVSRLEWCKGKMLNVVSSEIPYKLPFFENTRGIGYIQCQTPRTLDS